MQDVMNRGGPDCVLNRESMRSISGPKANHCVRLGEGAMHVPLITAVVGKKIIDHAIETRPVSTVVSIRCLCAGDCNMSVRVALDRGVSSCLISSRERDLHERSMIGPGSKVSALARFFGGVGDDRSPIPKTSTPLLVESRESPILLFQPATKLFESMWIPVEVHCVAV